MQDLVALGLEFTHVFANIQIRKLVKPLEEISESRIGEEIDEKTRKSNQP
jgi:hypothetical protein